MAPDPAKIKAFMALHVCGRDASGPGAGPPAGFLPATRAAASRAACGIPASYTRCCFCHAPYHLRAMQHGCAGAKKVLGFGTLAFARPAIQGAHTRAHAVPSRGYQVRTTLPMVVLLSSSVCAAAHSDMGITV